MDILVERTLNSLYIYLDILFLLFYGGLLFAFKRRDAIIVGILAGVVYFAVDYGYFYQISHTRQVDGANPFWFLLWLSMSYGFTNFTWIWLLLGRDRHAIEWSTLIVLGWLAIALFSQTFGTNFDTIHIQRTTNAYHGGMALILLIGYAIIITQNLRGGEQVNILWLMAIGIGVQFAWEAILLVTGIRPTGLMPLIVNSLIETNLGIPFTYLIHRAVYQARSLPPK